jgi:hypothetical protein
VLGGKAMDRRTGIGASMGPLEKGISKIADNADEMQTVLSAVISYINKEKN